MLLEPPDHIFDSRFLVRQWPQRLGTPVEGFRALAAQVRPIDGPVGQIVEPQYLTGRLQALDRFQSVGPPRVAGIDDHAPRERVPRGGGSKGVESAL